MARYGPKSRRFRLSRSAKRQLTGVALLLVGVGMLFLPRPAVAWIRLQAAPLFDWGAAGLFAPERPAPDERRPAALEARAEALEDAVIAKAHRLESLRQQVEDLSGIRRGLPVDEARLLPARFVRGRLFKGAEAGIEPGHPVLDLYDIDRGAANGVEVGRPLLNERGLVGVVEDVADYRSSVRLVTDSEFRLLVQVMRLREGKVLAGPEGIATGTGRGTVAVEDIARDHDVRVGDYVVTSSSPESFLPPHLVVGKITECRVPEASLFYEIRAEPRALPETDWMKYVYVAMPPEESSAEPEGGETP